MDRRKYARKSLRDALTCMCRIGDEEPLHGFIRNVGIMGVMVEVPDLEDGLIFECGQAIGLERVCQENGCLIPDQSGTVTWLYREYVGVAFASPIRDSEEELFQWLADHGQLCD